MFRSSTIPQRNKFCLSREQIIQDIESIYANEEERSKLYYCLDETPPKEHRFEKIEEFLKGTQDLEKGSNMLNNLKCEIHNLQEEIIMRVNKLKEVSGNSPESEDK